MPGTTKDCIAPLLFAKKNLPARFRSKPASSIPNRTARPAINVSGTYSGFSFSLYHLHINR